jgi:hypothetical protein
MKFIATIRYHGLMEELFTKYIPQSIEKAFEGLIFEEQNEFAKKFNSMISEWNSKWHEIHPELEGEIMDEISLMKYNRFIYENSQSIIKEINDNTEKALGIARKFVNNSIPMICIDPTTLNTYFEITTLGTRDDGSYAEIIFTPME